MVEEEEIMMLAAVAEWDLVVLAGIEVELETFYFFLLSRALNFFASYSARSQRAS